MLLNSSSIIKRMIHHFGGPYAFLVMFLLINYNAENHNQNRDD